MSDRTVLVIGGGGYVGSVLSLRLYFEGWNVRVFDTFWFGDSFFKGLDPSRMQIFKGDLRNTDHLESALIGVTDVVHLACISNDPSFDLNPRLGKSINLDAFPQTIRMARNLGVKRFIYASSSSVYGVKEEERVTENLKLQPLTDYSRFKAECEDLLISEINDDMTYCILRPATICGYSPRQRFDLVVNLLTAQAITSGRLKVFGGSQFRPNLHIQDMVECYMQILEADEKRIHGEIFNVGGENLPLIQIADLVSIETGLQNAIEVVPSNDLRSYRIDSEKIKSKIGFSPKRNVKESIREMVDAWRLGRYQGSLESPAYINIKRMQELNLG